MVTMLYRYASFKGYDVKLSTELTAYRDAEKVSSWALDQMKWAVSKGLITGVADGVLQPEGTTTRAQVATVLVRYNESVK